MSNTEPSKQQSSAAALEHTPTRELPPDVDRTIRYTTRFNRTVGTCRMRAWLDEHTVVVTELPDNEGMSVTNAAEHVAEVVEAVLAVRFIDDGSTYAPLFRLVEHYEATTHSGMSLSLVTFAGRDHGRPDAPSWRPLAADDWLTAVLDERASA